MNILQSGKKIKLIEITVIVIFLAVSLASCIGPGLSDYSIELINGYSIERINSETIILCSEHQYPLYDTVGNECGGTGTVIESYVSYYCQGERYIGVIVIPTKDTEKAEENFSYFLVDTVNHDVVLKGEAKAEYENKCTELGLAGMSEWAPAWIKPKN